MIKLTVTLEHRFKSSPDGRLWSQTMFPYSFWQRYLEVFDRVNILARVLKVWSVPEDWKRVDGRGVSFSPVPHYIGVLKYLLRARSVECAVQSGLGERDAIIMRVGSHLAACLEPKLRQEGRPYGVEVLGDPYDVFAPGSVRHPLRPFLRWWAPRILRRQCANACAAAYVTENALQKRYPPAARAFSTFYSDVQTSEEAIVMFPRTYQKVPMFKIITVGSLEQLYKAPDILIDSVSLCVREGLNIHLVLVGDGRHRHELEAKVTSLGLGARVQFMGQVAAGKGVRAQLDSADLFVLPSRTEGLPRAMIEAMARGLPCIGSSVGGIPELLPLENMVPPGNALALASKIREVLSDPSRMTRMSARNLKKAREFEDHILAKRRREFYQAVKDRTAEWLAERDMRRMRGDLDR